MKRRIFSLTICLLVIALLSSCANEAPYFAAGEISYLNTDEAKAAVQESMTDAGITKERQEVFWNHVAQYNEAAGENLTKEKGLLSEITQYDAYDLQDKWTAKYPDFMGYNCRITTYSLMGDFIAVENTADIRDEHLMYDTLALQYDDSALVGQDTSDKFRALFSIIPTIGSEDVTKHVEVIQENWKEKGVSFDENAAVSMISVFFHDKWDEETNELMAGHVGVLVEEKDGTLLFIEKVAFQEPYQAISFASRVELNDYLMGKYDIGTYYETARPFILENDKLLEGYRPNPKNTAE